MDEMLWLGEDVFGEDVFCEIEYLDNEGNQIASELIGYIDGYEIWLDYSPLSE